MWSRFRACWPTMPIGLLCVYYTTWFRVVNAESLARRQVNTSFRMMQSSDCAVSAAAYVRALCCCWQDSRFTSTSSARWTCAHSPRRIASTWYRELGLSVGNLVGISWHCAYIDSAVRLSPFLAKFKHRSYETNPCCASNGPITIVIRARFEHDSATTRYEVFRALAYEIVYENQW